MTDIQKKKCKQVPEWWTQENCCFDSLGEQVACRDLTEAEMINIAKRSYVKCP